MVVDLDPSYFYVKAPMAAVERAIRSFFDGDPYWATAKWAHDTITLRTDADTKETSVYVDPEMDSVRRALFMFLRGYYSGRPGKKRWRFVSY